MLNEIDDKRIDAIFQKMDRSYELYARSCGMSILTLSIFQYVYEHQPCTQKQVCEQLVLSKQTVNSAIGHFQDVHYLELREAEEDRRKKQISVTEEGERFANLVLPKIKRAEKRSVEQFTDEEKEWFLSLFERFSDTFAQELMKGEE